MVSKTAAWQHEWNLERQEKSCLNKYTIRSLDKCLYILILIFDAINLGACKLSRTFPKERCKQYISIRSMNIFILGIEFNGENISKFCVSKKVYLVIFSTNTALCLMLAYN